MNKLMKLIDQTLMIKQETPKAEFIEEYERR